MKKKKNLPGNGVWGKEKYRQKPACDLDKSKWLSLQVERQLVTGNTREINLSQITKVLLNQAKEFQIIQHCRAGSFVLIVLCCISTSHRSLLVLI